MNLLRNISLSLISFALCSAMPAQSAAPAQKPAPATSPAAQLNPDHATTAEVQKLFEAMHLRENNERLLKTILPLLDQQARQAPGFATMDDKDRAFFAQVRQEESSKLLDPAFVAQVTDLSIPAYAERLSPEDVKQITAFYNSPAGQHLQAKLPEIAEQARESALPVVRQRAQEIAADQQKKLNDYMTRKYGTTAPKGDPLAPKKPEIETLPK